MQKKHSVHIQDIPIIPINIDVQDISCLNEKHDIFVYILKC